MVVNTQEINGRRAGTALAMKMTLQVNHQALTWKGKTMLRDKSAAPAEARFPPSPLNTLKRLLSVTALGAGLMLAAGAAVAQAQPGPPNSTVEGQGKRFFEKGCAKCHEVGIGPVLTGRGLDPIFYTTIARHGNRAMPAFRMTDIDDATLQDLAVYLSKSPAKP